MSIGRQAPAQSQIEPASETKQPSDARSIECRILTENERTLELHVEAAFASEPSSDGTPPLLQIKTHLTVELDKPTVLGRIDDPNSDRSYRIELTATRIRDKS